MTKPALEHPFEGWLKIRPPSQTRTNGVPPLASIFESAKIAS